MFHGRVLCELDKNAGKGGFFTNAVLNRIVEIVPTSTKALVRARVWRIYNELIGAAVLEKGGPVRHHKLLRASLRHVVRDKRQGEPLRKTGGGVPEQHNMLR